MSNAFAWLKQPYAILAMGAVIAGGAALAGNAVLSKGGYSGVKTSQMVMKPVNLPPSEAYNRLKEFDGVFADLAQSVSDGVVNISTGSAQMGDGGSGSGFIYRSDGWIVTNDHVTGGRDTVKVTLNDGRELDGKVYLLGDRQLDIALVKIDASGLKTLDMADSDAVRPGEYAIAVGSPFGLQSTVTIGHVSAKNRPGQVQDPRTGQIRQYQGMIQTDASINPGNSGGPLMDINGNVIGVNSTIFSLTGSSAGVGFAIPSKIVKAVADEVIATGKFDRGLVGVFFEDEAKPYKLKEYGLKGGALIKTVPMDSPAFKAGLRDGDIITKFGSDEVNNQTDLLIQTYKRSPGQKVDVTYFRNGQMKSSSLTLTTPQAVASIRQSEEQNAPRTNNRRNVPPTDLFDRLEAPEFFPRDRTPEATPQGDKPRLGVGIEELTAESRSQFKVPADVNGVVVTRVDPGSVAETVSMEAGDLLESINGVKVNSVQDVRNAMDKVKVGDKVKVEYSRFLQGARQTNTVTVTMR